MSLLIAPSARTLTAVATIAAAAATLSVTVAAAAPPSLSVSPSTVRAGHPVKIKGSAGGCTVGNTVYVLSRAFARTHEFAGVPAVVAKVRTGGSFQAMTKIPRARKPGRYGVTARCGGGNLGVLAHLTVTS